MRECLDSWLQPSGVIYRERWLMRKSEMRLSAVESGGNRDMAVTSVCSMGEVEVCDVFVQKGFRIYAAEER